MEGLSRRPRLLAVWGAAVLLAGCGSGLRSLRMEGVRSSAEIARLKSFSQAPDECGPAALATVLDWAGAPEAPEALAPRVFLPGRAGTLPLDLAREIRGRGLLAYRVRSDFRALLREVAAGNPVLVLENRGLSFAPRWHYSVLGGYDLDEATVTLYAGGPAAEKARLSAFRRSWERGGSVALLALPPGLVPAAEDREGLLSALADLEEAGRAAEAARGYRASVERWPDSWQAAFALGNVLHAGGDDAGAEEWLRRANRASPERPEPLNNLALLALLAGNRDAAASLAREALERARALGVPAGNYEDTLAEVERAGGG